MARIVHCVPDLPIAGTQVMLHKTLRALEERHVSSLVISLTTLGPLGERMLREGIHVVALGLERMTDIPLGLWKLCRVLRRVKPALLQTYLYPANVFGVVAGRLLGLPVVCGLRCSEMDFDRYKPITGLSFRLNALLSGLSTGTVSNSEAGLRFHLARGFSNRRMRVIPNGFELDRFRPDPLCRDDVRRELGLPPDALLVGRFARLDPMKDYETFLAAAQTVAQRRDDVHFVLAGEGVSRSDPVFAPCDGRFHVLGRREDMPRLMAALDLFASSSAFGEGFPNVIGEAMACGVPCVVTDVGDSAHVVGETGRVVPPCDASALARAIEETLAVDRVRLGEAARRRVEQRFDIRKVAASLQEFYEEILRARRNA